MLFQRLPVRQRHGGSMVGIQDVIEVVNIEAGRRDLESVDILAQYLCDALNALEELETKVSTLNDCVDLLARHFQGSLDRLEIIESALQRNVVRDSIGSDVAPAIGPPAIVEAPETRFNVLMLPIASDERRAARISRFSDTRTRLQELIPRRATS
jgi:hypothetical protein